MLNALNIVINTLIVPLLAVFITGIFGLGFLPSSLSFIVLVPIIKDKCGKINNQDNYRLIALASILCKKLLKTYCWTEFQFN